MKIKPCPRRAPTVALLAVALLCVGAPGWSQPVITNTTATADAILFSGSGGVPGGTYRVLSSADLTTSVLNWQAVATNAFDSNGHFATTNPFSPGADQAYFAVQSVGDSIDFGLFGFGAGTTGGAGGTTQVVTTASAFLTAVASAGPRTIMVSGALSFATAGVSSDKTIIGLGTNTTLTGTLRMNGSTNVILRNLHISNPNGAEGVSDGITIDNFAHHVWVDHCTLGECTDGQIDITHGADFITISWCKFYYTNAASGHRFSSLVGHSSGNAAEDAGRLRITYHHNWWSTLVHERTPRVRFGRIHALNNLFWSPGNNYCIRTGIQGQVLSENNYFREVDEPYDKILENSDDGLIRNLGCEFDACSNIILYNDTVFTPPYSYVADPATAVPGLVTNNAGTGHGPFAP